MSAPDQTERAITVIAGAPGIWPHFEAGTRRYILHKFPYDVARRMARRMNGRLGTFK